MPNIIVIGGGAAGFFAAIHWAKNHPGDRVTILEKGKAVLQKVKISGGGRCNVTHACWEPRELTKFYPRGGKELLGPFHTFACGDTMGWFADRGVELKIEDDGRIFPVSDDSQTIIDCLWGAAAGAGVKVISKTGAEKIELSSGGQGAGGWKITTTAGPVFADRLIVATGSSPAAWKMLDRLGVKLVPPVPSLFSFNIKESGLRQLAGISLPWAQLNIKDDKLKAEGPLLITHRGLSGPAVLRLSSWGARHLHPRTYRFELEVNWLARRADDVREELLTRKKEWAKKSIAKNKLFDLPARLWQYLVSEAGINETLVWAQISKKQLAALTDRLTDSRYAVDGKATNKEEFVTAGGVDLKEIDFKDFSHRSIPNLHLVGEVLDIDAITGGFNFQAAWTGGFLVGGG